MLLVSSFRGLARHLQLVCLALAVAISTASAQTNSPFGADGFDPNVVDGIVYTIVAQGNGQLIVAGQFSNLQPNGGDRVERKHIARINPDGSLDDTFNPNVDGAVRTVALQDGRILIGGDFSNVGGVARSRIARLNSDGSLDSAFSPSISGDLAPQVFAIVLQGDGGIVAGGNFSRAQSTGSTTTIARNNLVRFDSTGVVDASYNPNPNGMVLALALYDNNSVIAGGGFTQFQPSGAETAIVRQRIARVNSNGTVDDTFDPNANNGVTAITVQRDGKILIGGYFTTLQPPGSSSAVERLRLARLDAEGRLDTGFSASIGGNVLGIAVAPDGSILVGGRFTQVWSRGTPSAARSYVARFAADGTLDESFTTGMNADVTSFAFQPDGKIILGGYFTRAQSAGLATALVRNRLARLLPGGAIDAAFQLDPGGRILASVVQSDGRIVVAGSFTNIGGMTRNYIARLNRDGTVDTTYNPDLNGRVFTLAYQNRNNENKILLGGVFTSVGGTTRNYIARLNPDGTVDDFNPNLDGYAGSIVVQSDGNILVGGAFSTVQPPDQSAAISRTNLLRLTSAGQLDESFNPMPNSSVVAIALQSDGKILIVGNFAALQPGAAGEFVYRNSIARLNANGSVDGSYDPNADQPISAIAIQADGKAIIGGRFTAFLPQGATEVVTRNYLARVNTDGKIDSTFDPNPNGMVFAIDIQPDNKIVVGGTFTSFQPAGETEAVSRRFVARLTSDGKVDTSLDLGLDEQIGGRVDSINVQDDGEILIGGTFTRFQPAGSSAPTTRTHFLRLTASGALDTFDPGAGGSTSAQIKALAVQPDGKILVGGNFSDLGGARSVNLARFHPEGSPDATLNTVLSTNGTVNAITVRATGEIEPTQLGGFAWLNSNGSLRQTFAPAIHVQGQINAAVVQPDGKVIVAGAFTDFSDTTPGNLIRFLPSGAVDTSFLVTVNGVISDLALQSDGKLVIVGSFTTVNGEARNRIARLDGTTAAVDNFDPSADGNVDAVVIQPDGNIVVGGTFSTLAPNGATAAVSRANLARLDANGNVDNNYNPSPNGAVFALALQSDNKIVAGGNFITVQPNNDTTTTTRNYIARFNPDGTVDTAFDPNADATVFALAIQPSDGSIVLGGDFSSVGATTRNYLARVDGNGTLDTAFDPSPNSTVTSLAVGPNGTIVVGGLFTTFQPNGGSAQIGRGSVARLLGDGTIDADFNPDIAGTVEFVQVAGDGSVLVTGTFTQLQPSGVILVGGSFTTVGGLAQQNLAQLNGDGSVRSLFQPNPNGTVNALLPLADGRFLVAGAFTNIAGAARNGIARFAADGALDTTFTPAITGPVTAMALQPDGKIVVGGDHGVARLNADGALDGNFSAGVPFAPVVALAVQPDGRILVAGPGSGVPSRIVRLHSTGSVDASFTPVNFSSGTAISALALEADGMILIAGTFTNLSGGTISRIARLYPDGSVDTRFNPSPNEAVSALAIQSDGRVILGGAFTAVGGVPRVGLARIGNIEETTQTLGVSTDGRTITWVRRGPAAELAAVVFEKSSDGRDWESLGPGTRIGTTSDWQLTDVAVPGGLVFVRARAIAMSGGQSTGVYEIARQVNIVGPVVAASTAVASVVTPVPWDETHFVWSYDAQTGVLRIVDVLSGVVVDRAVFDGVVGETPAAGGARLANLSTRSNVSAENPLITGFAVSGTGPRTVLVRAVGPSLAAFGVSDCLSTPQLRLYDNRTGAVIGENSGWSDDPALTAVFARTGAFPLVPGSRDAALVVTLQPGTYTIHVADAGGAASSGGNALAEVYDAGDLGDATARLTNVSGRGMVSAGGALIGGLVISGNANKTFLVRGIGPTLAQYGVGHPLGDPTISVYDATGRLLATNDNWNVSSATTVSPTDYTAAMHSAADSIAAFQLDNGSKDAALVITLPDGAYTVQVNGPAGASGAAMIELYELP